MNFLSHIHSKSRAIKTQYAFVISVFLTGIVVFVWVSTLPARFSEMTTVEVDSPEDPSTLDGLIDTTKTQLGSIIEATSGEVIEETVTTTNLDVLSISENPVVNAAVVTDPETPAESWGTAPFATTSPAEVPQESPKPTIILIGTTTSKQPTSTP